MWIPLPPVSLKDQSHLSHWHWSRHYLQPSIWNFRTVSNIQTCRYMFLCWTNHRNHRNLVTMKRCVVCGQDFVSASLSESEEDASEVWQSVGIRVEGRTFGKIETHADPELSSFGWFWATACSGKSTKIPVPIYNSWGCISRLPVTSDIHARPCPSNLCFRPTKCNALHLRVLEEAPTHQTQMMKMKMKIMTTRRHSKTYQHDKTYCKQWKHCFGMYYSTESRRANTNLDSSFCQRTLLNTTRQNDSQQNPAVLQYLFRIRIPSIMAEAVNTRILCHDALTSKLHGEHDT